MLQPVVEPWRTTVLRTAALALAIGVAVALYARRLVVVAPATLFALWFTLGGHYVELLFRNRLGLLVGGSPGRLAAARLVYWFVGGSALYAAALVTQRLLTGEAVRWPWWAGGTLFVGAELGVHLLLRARGQPSYYDGRG